MLFINMVAATSAIYQGGRSKVANNATGRAVMGAISRDLSDMIRLPDVAAFPEASGKRALAGYMTRAGIGFSSDLRNLSLVEYSFDPAKAKLVRSDLAIKWDELGKIAFGQTNGISQLSSATSREVCSGVIAFDYDFLMADGTFQRSFANKKDVKAVRYGLAIISDGGEAILKSQGKLDSLIQDMELGGATTNEGPKSEWTGKLRDPSLVARYPGTALRDVEVFERSIVLLPE
ncbi:MAG: hypothetical protein BGO12_09450 [Verrucomicrobia bacterium 61-8]|nr:MAG: hypothetical protein BGO12_09450 [Verrucomicrobia bacterium 61-8]